MYLTSEPDNTAAYRTWLALDFGNIAGDHQVGPVSVQSDSEGPDKDRAVDELLLACE